MKSKKPKEYPISDDIALLYDKYVACGKLRDLAIKLPFGYWKAKKAATDSRHFIRIFWKRIRQVYPELNDEGITYDSHKQIIFIEKENKEN